MRRFTSKILVALVAAIVSSWAPAALSQWTPPGGGGSNDEPNQFEGTELYRMTARELASLPSVEFGDSWNHDTGEASFTQTDISLPGNNKLPVAITRTRARSPVALYTNAVFGDWELQLPRVEYSWRQGWSHVFEPTRCRTARPADQYGSNANGVRPFAFYFGMTIHDLAGGSHRIMKPDSRWPSAALGAAPPLTTKSLWKISCLPNATNGRDGFLAKAPDGTTYRFDREVNRRPIKTKLVNLEVSIYPSVVTDVHGNTLTFSYNAYGPTRIEASDGRVITLTYNSAGHVTRVNANGRTWTYTYATESFNYTPITSRKLLTRVRRPDNREWIYSGFKNLDWANSPERDYLDCTVLPNWGGIGWRPPHGLGNLSVTHPNGSRLVLSFRPTKNGRVNGPTRTTNQYWFTNRCKQSLYNIDNYVVTLAVAQKRQELVDGPTYTWTYSYQEDEGSYVDQSHLSRTKKRTVIDPTGARTEYDVNRSHAFIGEGDIEEERRYANATTGSYLERKKNIYEQTMLYAPGYTPMPNNFNPGNGPLYGSSFIRMEFVRFLKTSEVKRGADIYTTSYAYDLTGADFALDNPTRITESASLGNGTRTSDMTYTHKTSSWVLNLPLSVRKNGKQFYDYVYSSKGQVTQFKRFGATWKTYGFHTSGVQKGALAWVRDALNRQTNLNNWKRGKPQSISRPDGTSTSRTVDNNGWVTSETNARGHRTNFQYNAVGWLTRIDRPSPWTDTTVSYSNLGSSNFYQSIRRGSREQVVWYDGLFRPKLERNNALSGGGLTTYLRKQYDGLGREIFASLPSTSSSASTGLETTYDALGRVTRQRENVSPYATTLTAYLSQNRIRVTDPEGGVTTTRRSGFGEPDDGNPTLIQQPLGINTAMSYDIYGNMLTSRQYGVQNGYSVDQTQRWSYDGRLRLCRHYAPETGSTLYQYDNANQMTAYGEGLSGTSGCASIPSANKVVMTYDGLGRNTRINYPGSTPDIVMTYDANGNVTRNLRGAADLRYYYDSADQLTEERLIIDGATYRAQYTFNADGFNTHFRSPSGRRVEYAPNGLGQPTKIFYTSANAHYANNVTYHANGEVKSLQYGNGATYATSQNARQLTTRIRSYYGSAKYADLSYGHDKNARVTAITDNAISGENRSFAYDDLGRLITASGPWGSGSFKYDALGNIRQKKLGARTVDLTYSSINRLLSVRDSGGSGQWHTYGYDARGNTTWDARGQRTYAYDLAQQPTSVSGNGASGSFVYDGNFKRVKQTIGGETIYSFYSLSGDLLFRDNRADPGDDTDRFAVAGVPVVRIKGGGSTYKAYFLHTDHLGSAVAATNGSRAIQWRESYTPFGETRNDPAINRDETGFTGHILDSAIGLNYMQARYYDPVIGRFLSNDPVGFDPASPQMFNRYSYVLNDPINANDPTGMECVPQTDGSAICDPPGEDIGEFTIPAEFQPAYVGKDELGYHDYYASASTPDTNGMMAGAIAAEVAANPTPNDGDSPATPEGSVNQALPFISNSMVHSFTTTDSNGNPLTVNVTIPGKHFLHPGYVAQATISDATTTRIEVVGEGNALIQEGPGTWAGAAAFDMKIHRDMRRAIYNYHKD